VNGLMLGMPGHSSSSLLTDRLHLRAADPSDVELFVALETDPRVRHYLGGARTTEEARRRAEARLVAAGCFTVLDRTIGERLGVVTISDRGHGGLELSYEFLPQSWGRGFGSEAVAAVAAWVFQTTEANELLVVTQAANDPSRRLLRRLGAVHLDDFEEYGETQSRYRITPPRAAP
jgi:RimJ/RimL family protein N-acetyltransferase